MTLVTSSPLRLCRSFNYPSLALLQPVRLPSSFLEPAGITMLSSSIRRVVRASAVSLPSVTPSSVGASSNGLLVPATRTAHQRRYSSSKPPVPPNDGSRPIDASSQNPAKVNPAGEKRASKRRSAKSSQHTAFLNLPSVPSTQHLQPHG